MNILITGANGQVGSELQILSEKHPNWVFYFCDKSTLDLRNAEAIGTFFSEKKINACINCAAYTAVDKAENHPQIAHDINVLGAENLAKAAVKNQAHLIHFSTDYVYHGNQNRPFREDDKPSPNGVYAATKLAGDERVLALHPAAIILRTSWVYSSFGNNFVKTMLRLGVERNTLSVVFDQVGTPTYAADLASTTYLIMSKLEDKSTQNFGGIYHYSNEGVTSWYDFAKAIFELAKIRCEVQPIETKDYPTPAARPHFSVLNKSKIKTTFDLKIPHWRDSLAVCLNDIFSKK